MRTCAYDANGEATSGDPTRARMREGRDGTARSSDEVRDKRMKPRRCVEEPDSTSQPANAHPRNAWLLGAVNKRLREEFAKLQVEINEEKSRIVDLDRGESFGFLGFDFRRLRSMKKQVWRAHYTPKLKKRTALLRKLKDVFRRLQSQPVDRVVQLINPILRGWVNYFAIGHSSECFSFIRDWVEKKIRRHLGRSRKLWGFGWKRWSRRWLYEELKLFNSYRVRRLSALKVLPA